MITVALRFASLRRRSRPPVDFDEAPATTQRLRYTTQHPTPNPKEERHAIRSCSSCSLPVTARRWRQTPARAAFEVASVKANGRAHRCRSADAAAGGRVLAINLPLREFIRAAYGLQDNQLVLASPVAETRFDLEARAGADGDPRTSRRDAARAADGALRPQDAR